MASQQQQPYFDDFDVNKGFYKVLFKPSVPVQTRELNQLQSILSNQANILNKHLFKEGAMIIPGNSSIDTDVGYVKLQSISNGAKASALVGMVLTGSTSGVEALVVHSEESTTSDPATIFVKYTKSGTNTTQKVFLESELLNSGSVTLAQVSPSLAIGVGSIASVETGFYYIKGYIVQVASQTITLSKYSNTPSYKIGLLSKESFISADEDETLLDNAQGYPNYSANGADRLFIDLTLTKVELDAKSVDSDFIQLIVVENGSVKQKINNTEYSILEKTLARRTYDESGDYTVKPFPIDVREYRNNYRGQWQANTVYLTDDIVINNGVFYRARVDGTSNSTAPTITNGSTTLGSTGVVWTVEINPFFNRGIYDAKQSETIAEQNANKAKLAIGLEPGKAYVRGYEIEKIGTEYVPINKARTYNKLQNVKVPANVGNYVVVTNLHFVPDISSFPVVGIYDRYTVTQGNPSGTLIGTARVRYFEYNGDTTQGTSTTRYKASLFDVKMSSGYEFNRDAKQLYIAGSSNPTSFTADVYPLLIQLTGSATSASTTVTGNGTLFLSELKVGDYITANAQIKRVTAITSNKELTVDSTYTTNLNGDVFYRHQTEILEQSDLPLIYESPYKYIKSMRVDGVNDTIYSITKTFTQASVTSGGGSSITLTVSGTDIFGSPVDTDNFLVVNQSTGGVVVPTSITLNGTSQQAVINLSSSTLATYTVLATVIRNGVGTEKTKTLTTSVKTITDIGAKEQTISLGKADGYRLLSVKMDTGSYTSPSGVYGIDITDRFVFNDGQTTTHYGLASITRISDEQAPTAPIQITFEYFEHSGSGDYFVVDSYLSTMTYDNIPYFGDYILTDCIDFRPRINDAGTAFVSTNTIPKRGSDVFVDLEYYLGRIDKVVLNQDGNFVVVSGTPDISPKQPEDLSTGMVLYKLNVSPYTYSTNIPIESIDNKRYTMRDIGKLEKRIDNVEYYTSLSLLEQQTQSLEIPDEFGLNRFKNGFIVDNFSSHGIGDVSSVDYSCSIDMENNLMRPTFYTDNINIIEESKTDAERSVKGYQVTGDLITLPYTEVSLVSQLSASRVENINPFAIFTFIGQATLNPPSDEWFEVNRLPDIVTEVEGNYTTMYNLMNRSGLLSTTWNAWQTQWAGSPSVSKETIDINKKNGQRRNEINQRFGDFGRGVVRRITTEKSAQTVGQSRTGVRTVVIPNVTREVTGDKTLSKAIIPYIRARSLLFVVRGLKPNTKFTSFFDSVDVSGFIVPSSTITINQNTRFDSSVRAGGDSDESSRRVNGSAESALDRGDVVFVKQRGSTLYTKQTSPATGVLALVVQNGSTTDLELVNRIGSFQVGDVVEGSITGATSTITGVELHNIGDNVVSNRFGDVVGIFNIPNTESLRFRCGTREFKLSDDLTDSPARTSFARKQYKAEGVLETKQASVTATRNAEIRDEIVSENRTVVQESSRVVSDTGWYDPLAQTFLVDSNGGAFVTSVDIWFATKDNTMPVRLDIREVVNGYPGKSILPFSQVVKEARDVNISSTLVLAGDGSTYPAPTTPTKFKFESPVYLNDRTEYCIVLMSDSNNYRAWISQLGDVSVISNSVISEQPYAGVFFKSQNASTWTADQSQDLMFRINKAKFAVNSFAEVDFVNASVPLDKLVNNPIYATSSSNVVRVFHNNHGHLVGSSVTLSGCVAGAGITANSLNATHTVLSVELDSYTISVADTATLSGYIGGNDVYATNNIIFSTIQPVVQQQSFPDTNISHTVRLVTGKSISGGETPYIVKSYIPVTINDNNELDATYMIANGNIESSNIAGNKSFKLKSRMITSNENVSPVIDIARLSLIAVGNRIDSPTESTVNTSIDTIALVSANNTVAVTNGNRFSTSNSTTMTAFRGVTIGKYIQTSGFVSGSNNGKFLVTNVASDGSYIEVQGALTNVSAGANVTVNLLNRFVSEIAPIGSSSLAKYVSNKIRLKNDSSFIRVRFAVDVSDSADITLYYKTNQGDYSLDLDKVTYTLATPIKAPVKSKDGLFVDVEYNINTTSTFNLLQVKLVSNSTKSNEIVRVKDLVVIACA